MVCYCDTTKPFEQCCKPVIEKRDASDVLALMRSRYTAFATGNAAYILATENPQLHRTTDAAALALQIAQQAFVRLEILDYTGESVHFKATIIEDGEVIVMEENSLFRESEKGWRYEQAQSQNTQTFSIGRNSPCPCQSGKKYKQCHQRSTDV